MVHGSLTGVGFTLPAPEPGRLTTPQHNILVDSSGVACISEYGLEVVLRDEASSKSIPTNVQWVSPEVLGTRDGGILMGDGGKAADVYSFAMIMFEVRLRHLYPALGFVPRYLILDRRL